MAAHDDGAAPVTVADDARLAATLARRAGDLLVTLRADCFAKGWSGKDAGRAGDHDANELLLAALAEARPGDAVLSEESADDLRRLDADRVWIVDPLDGTREYGLEGRTDWAVHVALWQRGVSPVVVRPLTAAAAGGAAGDTAHTASAAHTAPAAGGGAGAEGSTARQAEAAGRRSDAAAAARHFRDGAPAAAAGAREGTVTAAAVALPALGEVLSSEDAFEPLSQARTPAVTVVSDSRPPAWLEALGAVVDLEVVPMGSAGAKAMAVVRGSADAYVHSGGQYEWDSAAPVGVALAAGLHASRLDGSPLRYNLSPPYLPDLVICRADLAAPLLAALASVGAA